MKKSFQTIGLTLGLILSVNFAFAQGSWYIGGVAGYGSSTYEPDGGSESSTKSWAFGPEVGTFPKKDLQVGFILGLNGSTEEDDAGETTSSYFTPTLYVRKFKSVGDALSVFGGLYLNYSTGKVDYADGDEASGTGFGVNLGVGVAYALSPRFTAVGQYGVLGYSSAKYDNNGDEATQNDFNFGVNTVGSTSFAQGNGSGSVFNIGIYYTFKTGD